MRASVPGSGGGTCCRRYVSGSIFTMKPNQLDMYDEVRESEVEWQRTSQVEKVSSLLLNKKIIRA